MIDPHLRETFSSEPGSIVRTDYLAIMRLIRDNPGINKTTINRSLPCAPSTPSKKKRIDELIRAGLIDMDEVGVSCRFELTDRGAQVLAAAERLIEEVYRCLTTSKALSATVYPDRLWS